MSTASQHRHSKDYLLAHILQTDFVSGLFRVLLSVILLKEVKHRNIATVRLFLKVRTVRYQQCQSNKCCCCCYRHHHHYCQQDEDDDYYCDCDYDHIWLLLLLLVM